MKKLQDAMMAASAKVDSECATRWGADVAEVLAAIADQMNQMRLLFEVVNDQNGIMRHVAIDHADHIARLKKHLCAALKLDEKEFGEWMFVLAEARYLKISKGKQLVN